MLMASISCDIPCVLARNKPALKLFPARGRITLGNSALTSISFVRFVKYLRRFIREIIELRRFE